jgi:hypothetical protein
MELKGWDYLALMLMKESIYLETTGVSYYTSKPSRDIVVLAHQEITRQWWPIAIRRYDIFTSEVVTEEASFGDPESAKRRLEELKVFLHLVSRQLCNVCSS